MCIKRTKETSGKMRTKYHYCNFLNVSRRQECFKLYSRKRVRWMSKPSLPPKLWESQEQLLSSYDGSGVGKEVEAGILQRSGKKKC